MYITVNDLTTGRWLIVQVAVDSEGKLLNVATQGTVNHVVTSNSVAQSTRDKLNA